MACTDGTSPDTAGAQGMTTNAATGVTDIGYSTAAGACSSDGTSPMNGVHGDVAEVGELRFTLP